MKSLLIRNVTLHDKTTNILIEGNRFINLHAPAEQTADEVIDATGKAILPPFYNAHTHAAMTLLRGYADDMPLFPWLNDYVWPYEAHLTEEDVYAGSRLAILEMIKSGCVFFSDMYWNVEATLRAVEEMGTRAAIGITFMDRLSEEAKQHNWQLLRQWSGDADGRIMLDVKPHAIYTASEDLLRQCEKVAEQQGCKLHIHLSETQQEVDDCLQAHGATPVRWLDSIGLLTEHTLAAHVIHVDHEEIDLLTRRGVTVVHNPCSNMKLSSGTFPYQAFLASGCRIALGTDGASSNNNLDMREEMKFAALQAKLFCGPDVLPIDEVFRWATVNAAEAYGLDAGKIEEGKLADAILIGLNNERLVPCHHLLSNWVYAADSSAIDTVICNGRIVMKGRHVPHEEEIIQQAREACQNISRRMQKA